MEVLIFLVLIFFSAFFSSSETAIFSVSKFKLHSLVKGEKPGAAALARLKSNPNRLLATILVGNNLVNIFIASYATYLSTEAFGSIGVGIATGVVTIGLLILGDTLPKSLAAHNAVSVALFEAGALEVFSYILFPLVWTLEKISGFFTQLFSSGSQAITEEEIKSVIAISEEAGVLGRDAAEIMENVLEFEDVRVGEVMTPEASVIFIDGNKTIEEVMDTVVKTDYSRFPVFDQGEEDIIGILDIDFALREIQKRSWKTKVKDITVPATIVPESKKVADLLRDFAKGKNKFSLVVDEYGSFVGVVSLEDVLEEIVGDIFDKSLKIDKMVKPLKGGGMEVEGSTRIDDLEDVLHINLKGEGFNTLAGMIETHLGRIPQKGEKIKLKHFEVQIEEADAKAIKKVHLYHLPAL